MKMDHDWTELNMDELHIFLALNILMGIIRKPEIEMYWSVRRIFYTPIFSNSMFIKRFNAIRRNIHFTNNKTYNASKHPYPKLHKIYSVYNHLKKKFKETVNMTRDLAVDESMMLFKGRLDSKQYLPKKRTSLESNSIC